MKKTSHIILLVISLVFIGCKEQSDNKPKKPSQDVSDIANQNSIRVLKLSGTSYEIGFQHGQILKKEIHDLVALWESDIESNFEIPAEEFIKKFIESTDYLNAMEKWTPELIDEIKGISEGANIDFTKMFVFQLIDEMWTNHKLFQAPHHCTSVAIKKRIIGDSVNYIAQNIDVTPFYHKYKILLEIKDKESNNKKLITTFPGYIGANGINNNIGLTINSLTDLESSLDGLPVSCVVRGILNKNSFKDAEQFIRQIKHASGQNYTIGSKNNLASFECSASKISIYWPDTSKLYTCHANDALSNDSYHPTNKVSAEESSRLSSIKKRFSNKKNLTKETIIDALKSKDDKNDPVCNSWTWVSTIMEFHNNYNVLMISPGKPDSVNYEKYIIQ